jgi:hypothetical protein
MHELDDAGTRSVVALQRLQAAYADTVTRRDWAAVRDLFEPDAAVHLDLGARGSIELTSPAELVVFVERALEPFAFFEMAVLNAVVDLDAAAGATGRMYICELRRDRDGAWSEAYGVYRDRFTRRDGAWRFADRHYTSLAQVR